MRLGNKMFERKRYVVMRKDISVEWKNGLPIRTHEEIPVKMLKVKGAPLVSQDVMAERIVAKEFGLNHTTFPVARQARRYYEGLVNNSNSFVGRGSVF